MFLRFLLPESGVALHIVSVRLYGDEGKDWRGYIGDGFFKTTFLKSNNKCPHARPIDHCDREETLSARRVDHVANVIQPLMMVARCC